MIETGTAPWLRPVYIAPSIGLLNTTITYDNLARTFLGLPMASHHGRSNVPENDSVLGTALTTRHIEAFSRKVTSTANHLIGPLGDSTTASQYQYAMNELHKEFRRPGIQRRVFSYAQSSPTELVRARLSTTEIQHRALTFIPDEILKAIPETDNVYSLFQGFKATLPQEVSEHGILQTRDQSANSLLHKSEEADSADSLPGLTKKKDNLSHRVELLEVRKNLCSSEIREIDGKISNLQSMRKIVLDRLSGLEEEEASAELELSELEDIIEDLQEQASHAESSDGDATPAARSTSSEHLEAELANEENGDSHETFMSASIYEKISTPKAKRQKPHRRKSVPIRHEHFEPGTNVREIPAHSDTITAIDFDAPFGTLVSSALDDTVRVWDLNLGRCIGFLEGHRASVRCLQVEDHIVATGSIDASIKLWDLSKVDYATHHNRINKLLRVDDSIDESQNSDEVNPSPSSNLQACQVYSLEAHVDEVTALHHRMNTLISGSADKTLRQWDLIKGRCVQTLDVLWAAAQASATQTPTTNQWHKSGRSSGAAAAFVGALQCFDAALACGTADGMVRLWDLRSGQVGRSLVGHTGPITSLQFDDMKLVTGSLDRSIRIWDLRTGGIFDAYAYDNPITSMMFDTRRIVAAAGEDVVKVYDETDGKHWDCGAGASSSISEQTKTGIVERVRIKEGYLVEGRKDGVVGVWTC